MKHTIAILFLFSVSCKSTQKTQPIYQQPTTPAIAGEKTALFNNGIDFIASGDKPINWQLSISISDSIRFRNEQGIQLTTRQWQKVVADTTSDVFVATTSIGSMSIYIDKEYCEEKKQRRTSVLLGKDLKFTGCGEYIVPNELNGKWVLEKISGKSYTANDFFDGLPSFEINTATKKLTGNDGCNNIFADITIEGKIIRFGNISSTKKYCGANAFADKLQQQISGKTVTYSFKDKKLIFYLYDDSTIEFSK